jgi:superfamily II DNA or RNA helicase
MRRRPNQIAALEGIERAIMAGHRNICCTSPTGGGKSLIMFDRIADTGLSTTVYTDRRMLLSQIRDGMERHGIDHGLRVAGEDTRLLDDVQLCMVQTEASRSLKSKHREVHAARQVLIDEVHKNSGDTMQALLAEHRRLVPDSVMIGFTATPLGIGHLCDHLVVAGTNSELRAIGALVPSYHYGPDEPDVNLVGKVVIGEGECGIPNAKRMAYAMRVFGRVVEQYNILNPDRRPTILFAPGVAESKWLCESLNRAGITAAHIDGESVVMDGETLDNSDDVRAELRRRCEYGEVNVVCNRFVLREGIDWPFVSHGIFATIFGSLTSYIQAGGRLLRACDGKDRATLQDHGGNWWRHGSLNADREWDLTWTDRIAAGVREKRIREGKEPEPIVCQQCGKCRLSGAVCHDCGYRANGKSRPVLQADGSLREMRGDIFRARRTAVKTQKLEDAWRHRCDAIARSKKDTVRNMTFAQLEATFARENKWLWPPRDMRGMPVNDADWFRPIREVPMQALIQ